MGNGTRQLAATFGVLFVLATVPVLAAVEAKVIGLNLTTPGGGPTTATVFVAVQRGIDTGARVGNAPFHLVVIFTYQYSGQSVSDTFSVALAETTFLGYLDKSTVAVEFQAELSGRPDQGTIVTATARVVSHEPDGTVSDVTAASVTPHEIP